MTNVPAFMHELQSPETLLRHFHVTIAGSGSKTAAPPNGQAVIRRFKATDGSGTAAGFTTGVSGFFGGKKNRPAVMVSIMRGVPIGVPNADEFDAFYIPMVQTADVGNNHSHYTLPTVLAAGQPDLMITSQLSGCSFGVGSDAAGATLVSHVQPNQALGAGQGNAGFALRTADLATNLQAGFHNMSNRFALQNDYTEKAAVIGKLVNGDWKFYLQANRSGHSKKVKGLSII